jgi:aminopeptidase N
MRILSLLVCLLCYLSFTVSAQVGLAKKTRGPSRSDTMNIAKTTIVLNSVDFTTNSIAGYTQVKLKSKSSAQSQVFFDFEGLIVDSVIDNTQTLTYSHTGALLNINLSASLNVGDSVDLKIYYHGTPLSDPQWGGFYFTQGYAFNMGVGFASLPHSVGRYWFPCFDNFVERCPFEFFITTDSNMRAACNGLLIDSTINANTITWHWNLSEEIPSYLAGVAVAPYTVIKSVLTGLNGNTPSEITCLPSQVTNVNASFAQLQQSFDMLEKNFGAHKWPKVGYTLVPFSAGAMEHATNIHIGKDYIDGTLNYATLIAHELSHHWFGDLATCSSAEDMWLNEGFASYCEMLHTEYVSGSNAYLNAYRDNHYKMLSTAHINDNGYRAVSPMSQQHTYGSTVYNKGADMIHTLRSYLGDSLFFLSLKNYLSLYEFKDASTQKLSDVISSTCGKNYQHFFDGWILQAGFPNFCVDSTIVRHSDVAGYFEAQVFVRQRKQKNATYFKEVPIEITYYKPDFSYVTREIIIDERCAAPIIELDFEPVMITLDANDKLSDATTWDAKKIKATGFQTYTQGKARARILTEVDANDSSLLLIEHHWTSPDRFKGATNDYILHDNRYWHVDGINLDNITGHLIFNYSIINTNSYLDSAWFKGTEDNIQLFYRAHAREEWVALDDSLQAGSLTDGIGSVVAKEIKSGDYALAIKRPGITDTLTTDALPISCANTLAIDYHSTTEKHKVVVKPNPANGFVDVVLDNAPAQIVYFTMVTSQGKLVKHGVIKNNTERINTQDLPAGLYQISVSTTSRMLHSSFVQIQK